VRLRFANRTYRASLTTPSFAVIAIRLSVELHKLSISMNVLKSTVLHQGVLFTLAKIKMKLENTLLKVPVCYANFFNIMMYLKVLLS